VQMDACRALNLLKVQELKLLCKEHGLPSTGRKLDLIERLIQEREAQRLQASATASSPGQRGVPAATAADSPVLAVEAVAERLLQRAVAVPQEPGRGWGHERRTSGSGRAPSGRSPGGHSRTVRPAGELATSIGAGDQAAGSPASSRQRPLRCIRCAAAFDLHYTGSVGSFQCPACRVKLMDPFNAVVEPKGLLKLAFITHSQLSFTLDVPELRQWRREGLGVELRMVRVDSSKITHAWPHSLGLLVNGGEVFAVSPPEEGHKRRDVPQNISVCLKPGFNECSLHVVDEHVSDFVMAVLLTAPCDIPQLSLHVGSCSEAAAAARIRSLLAKQQGCGHGESEDVVCLTSDTLRLICPITMERVQQPVRGERCQHLQCFSLEAYLSSNRQIRAFNNRWQCPICTLILRPADLLHDPYVARILSSTPADVEEVVVASDGAWRCREPVLEKPDSALPHPEQGDTFDLDAQSSPVRLLHPKQSDTCDLDMQALPMPLGRLEGGALPTLPEAGPALTPKQQGPPAGVAAVRALPAAKRPSTVPARRSEAWAALAPLSAALCPFTKRPRVEPAGLAQPNPGPSAAALQIDLEISDAE